MGGLLDDWDLTLSYCLLVVMHVCIVLSLLVCIDYIYIYSCFIFYRVRLVVEKWGVDKSASWTRLKLNLEICYRLVHC